MQRILASFSWQDPGNDPWKHNKKTTFPPQGFGSHQDIHWPPVTCQKSQVFPSCALQLAWNYATHEAKPVQQPLHKASHHSVSNSLTQVHTRSQSLCFFSSSQSLLIQTWQSGVSPSSLYLFLCRCFLSALPGGATRGSAADCSCWSWSTAWHLLALHKTNRTQRVRGNWVRKKFLVFFFFLSQKFFWWWW